MTEEEEKIVKRFEARVRHLILLYHKQQEQIVTLNDRVQQLNSELSDLNSSYRHLKDAKRIEVKSTDLSDTKRRLSNLVREVDQCITMLSHEAEMPQI